LLDLLHKTHNGSPLGAEASQTNIIHCGDCLEILPKLSDESINLVVTSPPYADSRKKTYGGIPPDRYVEWFLPISRELKRLLKKDGSFVLNIKEKVIRGERHPYVLELILAMKKTRLVMDGRILLA
jgi:DNA modification methylase